MKTEVLWAVWLPQTMVLNVAAWDIESKCMTARWGWLFLVWLSKALSGYQKSHFGTGTSALRHTGKWQHYIWTRWTALYEQHPSQPFQNNLPWSQWALCHGKDPGHANLVSIKCAHDAFLQSCRDLMGHRIRQWQSGMWWFCLGKGGTDQDQCMN